MSQFFVAERQGGTKGGDPVLSGLVLLLAGMGLVVLFSASYYRSLTLFDTPFQFITNQSIYALGGIVAALLLSRLNPAIIRRVLPFMVLICMVLMVATFIQGLGASFLGGRRWIVIGGNSFQPSELVKITLVVYLASFLANRQDQLDDPRKSLLPPFLLVGLFVFLIFQQNNFSTALFVLVISVSIFFIAGVRVRYFILLALVLIPLVVIAVFARDHRVERLSIFMEPEKDPMGSGYQTLTSQATIKSGQFFGKGIGLGKRKLGTLPEAHSDYIFAIASEELGFLGVTGILGLFATFAWRGFRLAWLSTDPFDRLLAFGLTASITLQALINMAVTAGVVPPTGIPLPFFSSGGSSLFLTFCMVGLLMNVARRIEAPEEAHG